MDIVPLNTSPEWSVRVELAAASRILAHYGFDSIDSQICTRVPGERDAFLIRPVAMLPEEATAADFVKYDVFGSPRDAYDEARDRRELAIHAGLFALRADADVTLHAHSPAIAGVASQRDGLLPVTYHALPYLGWIGYIDFAGLDTELEQRDVVLAELHGRDIVFVRDGHVIILAQTIGGAVTALCELELACREQLAILAGGGTPLSIAADVVRDTQRALGGRPFYSTGGMRWRGMMRLVDRLYPGYR